MRLSDLLRARVIDPQGKDAGRVHDVRLVQDGPMIGSFGASFRLEGLIVGKGSIGSRLGYDRSEMKGPYLLKKMFGRLLSSARFVDWGRVVAIEEGKIFVDQPLEEMRPPEILTARRSG